MTVFVPLALRGEEAYPGRPGCVWIDLDEKAAQYRLLENVGDERVRQGLEALADAGDKYLMVRAHKGRADVFAVAKEHAHGLMDSAS